MDFITENIHKNSKQLMAYIMPKVPLIKLGNLKYNNFSVRRLV